jgi:hypothetical protein
VRLDQLVLHRLPCRGGGDIVTLDQARPARDIGEGDRSKATNDAGRRFQTRLPDPTTR